MEILNNIVNSDKRNIAIVVLLILLLLGGAYHFNAISDRNKTIQEGKNLQHALTDTLHTFKNKENQWVSEKLTLQADTKDLKDKNLKLSSNQTELVKKVEEINKNNQVISAALIQFGVKLDGVINNNAIVENDSTIEFPANTDSIKYKIIVSNVKQYGLRTPVLEFKEFDLPNKMLIDFHWKDDKKDGYPISFSVTNSNPYYKVHNIDSYAIPELQKTEIKPNFWNKLGKFTKSTGGKLAFLGIGFVAGVILVQ